MVEINWNVWTCKIVLGEIGENAIRRNHNAKLRYVLPCPNNEKKASRMLRLMSLRISKMLGESSWHPIPYNVEEMESIEPYTNGWGLKTESTATCGENLIHYQDVIFRVTTIRQSNDNTLTKVRSNKLRWVEQNYNTYLFQRNSSK